MNLNNYSQSLFCLDNKEKRELQKSNDYCNPFINIAPIHFEYRKQTKMIRQYTFTCEQDFIDVKEGYCPSYAVNWLDEQNRSHWPEGTKIQHRPEYIKNKEEKIGVIKNISESNLDIDINQTNEKNVHFDVFHEIIPIFDDDNI
jgi:hypothetical protein